MYGRIIRFDDRSGIGVIAADDGQRFRFMRSEVISAADGLAGCDVDFLLAARRPKDIVVMTGSPWTAFGVSR